METTMTYDSPIGVIYVTEDGIGLTEVGLSKPNREVKFGETPLLIETIRQLKAYFAGTLKVFDLPLAPKGTAFQKKVWEALVEVPYGETMTYGDIARRIDNPRGCRAVGGANNKNPIMIIVPCHRIIGKDGTLVGYESGLKVKEYLLELEGIKWRKKHMK